MSDRVHNAADTSGRRGGSSGKSGKVSLSPRQLAKKRAFRDLVEAAGGLDAAAMFCRLGKSQLQRCYDRNTPDAYAPIDVVDDLEEVTRAAPGWPHVTRLHARELGLLLLDPPASAAPTADNLMAALARASREHSDIATGLLEALQTGVVDPEERQRLRLEALESAEAAMLIAWLLDQGPGEP